MGRSRMYACGDRVRLRAYRQSADVYFLKMSSVGAQFNGYKSGTNEHYRCGPLVSDADTGEDKMELVLVARKIAWKSPIITPGVQA